MTENLHADCVQSRQAGFMQCFLYYATFFEKKQVFFMKIQKIRFSPLSFRQCTVLSAASAAACEAAAGVSAAVPPMPIFLHQQDLFRISNGSVIGILQTTVLLPHDLLQTVLLNGTQKRLPYEYAQKQYKSLLSF